MHSENRTKYVQKLWEVWKTAARLGLVSFGGPVAHLGYFREEYVKRKQWIDEKTYADLVALCQLLPGPASSQVGIGIGFLRAGMLGAVAAWLGFTLPSALILLLFAYFSAEVPIDWLHGLLVVAVAVVAHAVWGMAKVFAPDRSRATIAVASAILSFSIPNAGGQVAIIIVAGMIGSFLYRHHSRTAVLSVPAFPRKTAGVLLIFFMLLGLLPIVARLTSSPFIALFDSFYRAGALVFGGGHVVLPLLQSEVVPKGWVTDNQFLAGYGMAQAVPGPLFTFATYVGMASFGWKGAIVATIAIFLPSFLLVIGTLPFWEWIRQHSRFQAAFHGIHAAVVGLLLAALYHPVWTKAIQTPADFCLALAAFCLLTVWKCPPLVVVIISAMIGALI
ncbi:ChrA protein [Anoxybacillus gonensis]|uniref:Chromate transporter n=1 Tax=Anoxybacillus gonensis TaxID=198467 RepID=A0AAW7TIH3_9BACL|nr:chromate transporter [Anoxybacillus gonensis]AKS38363.1 ChrA protein [Anoxybacillus gonensis]KGP60467.1 ChrA protein [Anoxybacillus gonensis]MCX8046326.1 chromate transporter [Anoxybacillus gonensis]MDO0877731.1 chromate transporter [Anoxybacillus gonensis]